MIKKTMKIVATILVFSTLLCGCNGMRTQSNDNEIEHIVEGNKQGYYLDFYSEDSQSKERNGHITLTTYNDNLYFNVENVGKRQLSVRIFVDYQQVPIKIGNQIYETFLIEASENYAKVFSFQLVDLPDVQYNHSITAILTAGSDIYTSQVEFEMSESYSIGLNHTLSLEQNKPMIEPIYEYDKTQVVTNYKSAGLLLNTDVTENKRTIPDRELSVKMGEIFALQYQVGGYQNCDDVAIIITVGLEQAEINGQKYLLCKTENGELVHGIANLKAPTKAGLYEVMGWVVKEPYASDNSEYLPLDSAYRFTLNVK